MLLHRVNVTLSARLPVRQGVEVCHLSTPCPNEFVQAGAQDDTTATFRMTQYAN